MDEPQDSDARAFKRSFWFRRLHALTGIVPLGAFLVMHLATNHRAVEGRPAFDSAVGSIQAIPLLPVVEVVTILAPLAYHALYGLWMVFQSRPNVGRYPTTHNWMYFLQRVTGVVALAFLVLHLGQFRVAKAFGHLPWTGFYPAMAAWLAEPGMFALYMVGLTATIVHFANGLHQSGMTWGFAVTPRARRTTARMAWALGLGLWLLGADTLYHFFARCGGLVPSATVERQCRGADLQDGRTLR